ncbi:MAG: hypothetical protein FJ125_03270, partial [Deltaproteobacteria bacterium]|nr:hypothetical protein [Deltaproteobacteria bacterium]
MFFCGDRAFEHLLAQTALGVRAPGTAGHEAAVALIRRELSALGLAVHEQRWQVPLFRAPGNVAQLTNLLVCIPGQRSGKKRTLLGTHYDTRWIADREQDPVLRD